MNQQQDSKKTLESEDSTTSDGEEEVKVLDIPALKQ